METFHNHPLAPYTTVKIGGPADTLIITSTSEEFINTLKQYSSQPITILGNGSNVLISDRGIRGTVIKNLANQTKILANNQIKVDSGAQLPQLLMFLADHQLSGLEEFAYIPSSIGGAIYGNIHGVNKNNFDKFLVSIEYFDLQSSKAYQLTTDQLKWDYDFSDFQNHPNWIILSCVLQLSPGDTIIAKQTIADIITKKTATQSMNSLGSVFKNPQGDSAGRIIDQELNLKGFKIGDAQISPKHANFIVNLEHSTASDYLAVIRHVQTQAQNEGFNLELEIKLLGKF